MYRYTLIVTLLLAACGQPQSGAQAPLTPAVPPPSQPIGTDIRLNSGTIRGAVGSDGLKQYHGIPYAAPPVGELRWAPPRPVAPWNGVLTTTEPGPACMQPQGQGGSFYGQQGVVMDEDCLTLNVWTRAEVETANLPVMVWVHGGALVTGSGAAYPGELLTSKGVVLVTINYRLGRFGFLAHPELSAENNGVSGNQGLRDQILALQWVRDNIRRFGGDPDNVTIFGESAGSLSMSLLQASPLARGLFHRVIGQSGGAFQPMWFADRATRYAPSAESAGVQFATALAAESADLTALRALSQERVLEVMQSKPEFSNYDSLAIVDGEVIPKEVAAIFAAGEQADVPVLIGSNADEGTTFLEFFTPLFGEGTSGFQAYARATLPEVVDRLDAYYPNTSNDSAHASWVNMFSDVLFAYPMRYWARSMQNVSSDAYLYWFTWAPPVPDSGRFGAFHAAELGYVFGNTTMFGATPTAADAEFSDLMASIWARFARSGSPNGPGLPEWPAYSSDTEAYMELGAQTGARAELRIGQMDLIEAAWQARRQGVSGAH